MYSKIIDFNKSKAELINKMYPNVSKIKNVTNSSYFIESNKALDAFQSIFFKYENSLAKGNDESEVKLEEVLEYFNRYFDSLYKELVRFDSNKVPKFKEALDYAMLGSGKRMRPFLMLTTYNFCMGENVLVLSPLMVAMEMIHTFSLVHDDLPCMDNDELRRGKLSVWKKYGEDIGVLVGDALMMEASTVLADMILELCYTEIGSFVTTSCLILLKLAGLDGMITGQVFDVMNTTNKKLTLDDINFMYEKKTTALITASMVIGANMTGRAGNIIEMIERLSDMVGESYQIKDDLLEIEGTTEEIGKSAHSDEANGKITYVTKVGVEKAKERLETLYIASMQIIDRLTGENNYKEALVLKELINYLLKRKK